MQESPLAGNPEFVPGWDVYRDANGNPVTVTEQQCAAIWHAISVVDAVRRAEGHGPLSRAEIAKSRLLGRMLYEGLPPTKTKPPKNLGGPDWALLRGGDPFGPEQPRVRIDLNVRLGRYGTYAGFEDVEGVEPAQMKRWDRVRVFEGESGLEGPAAVERVDTERQIVYLQVDWPLLGANL